MRFISIQASLLTAFALSAVSYSALGQDIRAHGLSSFGDLKYEADFRHFDYVNPDAPKGGLIRIRNLNSFDSVNPFILKGKYEVLNADKGGDLSFNFASLMTRSYDEPDAVYGLVAKEALLDDDGRWVEFTLRKSAVFHDGSPMTAEDVAYTFNILYEEGHPRYRQRFRDIKPPVILAADKIRFDFREGALTRGLPLEIAKMPILSKKSFKDRTFKETTMTPLLGSGPYRMVKVDPGRAVTYERVENHWAENLPVHKGRYNFDTIRVDYYRDRTIATEAFFAGEYDFREEFTSRSWATEYDGKPAVEKGLIKREVLKDASLTGFQAFFFNTRRDQFKDPRVRRALARMFDFEWTNKNLFYNSYERLTSVFENSDMKADGKPSARELVLLEPWRGKIPDAVFGEMHRPPVSSGNGKIRSQIRSALKELKEAGWVIRDKKLVNKNGKQMTMEFLLFENSFTRIINPFIRNLERIGVDARIRILDVASWQNRLQSFDFDIIVRRLSQPAFPGVGLRDWWGSKSADIQGGRNIAGVKSEAVDALIEHAIRAKGRDELATATRALDRVLMWGHYTVPQWFKASHFLAYWDRFGKPEAAKPGYDRAALHTWWYDTEKAAHVDAVIGR